MNRAWVTIAIAACALAMSCALNPATGKRQLSLVGESQEVAMGRDADRSIVAEMGLYDDDALQAYVQRIGDALAAQSERPQLDWSFRVIDDTVVNAFALPGGYIYVTRGILAHFENEAELAAVLGHEIGHVTARHGVSQMSKAQLAQLGLGLGQAVLPEKADLIASVFGTGVGVMFLKFGRDDERQADDLGLRYVLRTEIDPRPMTDVFDMLGRVSATSSSERLPGWLSTHPSPENREGRIEEQLRGVEADLSSRRRGGPEYRDRIDGIAFGPDPREGYFDGSLFLHPQMQFRFVFPDGWKLTNGRKAVVARSEAGDAAVLITVSPASTVDEGLRTFFEKSGIARTGPAMNPIHGLPTAGDGFLANTDSGTVRGRIGYVRHSGAIFELLGYSSEGTWSSYQGSIRTALASFDRLTEARYLDVEPKRLVMVTPATEMTLQELARRYHATVPVETLALLNRLSPEDRLRTDRSYKVVTGGRAP